MSYQEDSLPSWSSQLSSSSSQYLYFETPSQRSYESLDKTKEAFQADLVEIFNEYSLNIDGNNEALTLEFTIHFESILRVVLLAVDVHFFEKQQNDVVVYIIEAVEERKLQVFTHLFDVSTERGKTIDKLYSLILAFFQAKLILKNG